MTNDMHTFVVGMRGWGGGREPLERGSKDFIRFSRYVSKRLNNHTTQ